MASTPQECCFHVTVIQMVSPCWGVSIYLNLVTLLSCLFHVCRSIKALHAAGKSLTVSEGKTEMIYQPLKIISVVTPKVSASVES